ncbi:MAG: hypothetical protein R2746_10400 [Acidimicrobiales bacterium]
MDLGVEVRYETRLGTDVTLAELRRRHDALFGIGATSRSGLDIEGADADGVFKAIEFLINMNRGFEVAVGERVLVVGGGDVAMDAARTALRAADYQAGATAARRAAIGAADVAVAERSSADRGPRRRPHGHAGPAPADHGDLPQSREEMPAHEFEVEAEEDHLRPPPRGRVGSSSRTAGWRGSRPPASPGCSTTTVASHRSSTQPTSERSRPTR